MSTTSIEQDGPVIASELLVLNGALAKCVIAALADEFSRRILSSALRSGKTVQEISLEQAVPLSTCYRRVNELVDRGLLILERIVVTGEGKRYAVYRSSFLRVKLNSDMESISGEAVLNPEIAEKFCQRWLLPGRSRIGRE